MMRALLPVLIFSIPLFFVDLGGRDLWASHEARAAQNAQDILEDHSWGLPHLYDGQIEEQKPPAYYWMVALFAEANGEKVNAWCVRLPAALAALGTVLLVFGWLYCRGRPVEAQLAALILTGANHFTGMARVGRIDMPLTFAVSASLFLATSNSRSLWRILALAGTIWLGVMLKGLLGVALPVAVLVVWHFIPSHAERGTVLPFAPRKNVLSRSERQHWGSSVLLSLRERIFGGFLRESEITSRSSSRGARGVHWVTSFAILLGVALGVPWYIWADQETAGEFTRVFFIYHHFHRAFGGSDLGGHPWWFYVPRFAIDFLPWTPFLIGALFVWRRSGASDPESRFGIIWFLTILALLSISRFKRADYLTPAYPGAAIFLGCMAERWYSAASARKQRVGKILLVLCLIGCQAGWIVFERTFNVREGARREQSGMAKRVREYVPQAGKVCLFRVESHLLTFHLGKPVRTLVEWDDLKTRLQSSGGGYFVTQAGLVGECKERLPAFDLSISARSEDFSPVRPLRPLVLIHAVKTGLPPEIAAWPTD